MAATRKKNTRNKNSSGNRKKSVKTQTKRAPQQSKGVGIEAEIILWMMLAVSVLLLISNFGIGGAIGSVFSSFFFGLVGLVCYPLPIFLFLGSAFVISNGRNPKAYRKMMGFLLLFMAACMLMQLLTEGAVFEKNILTYYEVSAEYKTGGGLLGGILCRLCVMAFGAAGTYVIAIAAIMISLVLITQKSMFDMIKNISKWIYTNAAERRERKKKQQESAGNRQKLWMMKKMMRTKNTKRNQKKEENAV